MKVALLWEWDNPKDEERNKKRLELGDRMIKYFEKLVEEKGIKVQSDNWSDNTGHMVNWGEYESLDEFAKVWNDEKWQQMLARYSYFADNVSVRLLRPSMRLPEEI